jgi:hypothetical protein
VLGAGRGGGQALLQRRDARLGLSDDLLAERVELSSRRFAVGERSVELLLERVELRLSRAESSLLRLDACELSLAEDQGCGCG